MSYNSAEILNDFSFMLNLILMGKNASEVQEASPCTAGTAALQANNPNRFDTGDKCRSV